MDKVQAVVTIIEFILIESAVVYIPLAWLRKIERREELEERRQKMIEMLKKEWDLPIKYMRLRTDENRAR